MVWSSNTSQSLTGTLWQRSPPLLYIMTTLIPSVVCLLHPVLAMLMQCVARSLYQLLEAHTYSNVSQCSIHWQHQQNNFNVAQMTQKCTRCTDIAWFVLHKWHHILSHCHLTSCITLSSGPVCHILNWLQMSHRHVASYLVTLSPDRTCHTVTWPYMSHCHLASSYVTLSYGLICHTMAWPHMSHYSQAWHVTL